MSDIKARHKAHPQKQQREGERASAKATTKDREKGKRGKKDRTHELVKVGGEEGEEEIG